MRTVGRPLQAVVARPSRQQLCLAVGISHRQQVTPVAVGELDPALELASILMLHQKVRVAQLDQVEGLSYTGRLLHSNAVG